MSGPRDAAPRDVARPVVAPDDAPGRLAGRSAIVAGAGLAGLAAAWQLRTWGCEVRVLEARERIGGRVWTVRNGFVEGQHAEAGADLIDEGQTTIRDFARRFGLVTVRILRDGFASYRLDDAGTRTVRRGVRGWDELYRRLADDVRAFRAADCDWTSPVAAKIGQRSIAHWLDDEGAGPALRSMATSLRGFFAADPDDLSLLVLVDQLAHDDPPGLFRIANGNDTLAAALARGIDVALGHVVRAVRDDGARVTVRCSDLDGRSAEASADAVVLALPAPLLRAVVIEPAPPDRQAEAIARLRHGPATKASLQFAQRFWRAHGRPSAVGSDMPHGAVWDANEQQAGEAGILTLLAGGGASDALSRRLAGDGIDALRRDLAWLGADESSVVGLHVARWGEDPWSRGAYAAFDAGFAPALRP
ncbi:FAD-dependent oxidoreductase, partial [Candidatus Binatia bacterium]|nr:FAD-dependent oxidoreductase [Candidatus Binatia bacterium]